MPRPYTFYALITSMYAGKLRGYLRYKAVPHVEKVQSLYNYMVTTKRRTGSAVMPVVVDPDGAWLADTSDIIDELERRFPASPIVPATPLQAFAAYLFELWGDEFWTTVALHTRWSHPENYPVWVRNTGLMMPGLPWWLRRLIVDKVARPVFGEHLPRMGVVPENAAVLDAWTARQLDLMEAHFARHRFLFGTRPSLGDFGLLVTPFGHMSVDPWSIRHLTGPRPQLSAWVRRTHEPAPLSGAFLPDDQIPATLLPMLRTMLREMTPYLQATLDALRALPPQAAGSDRLPRLLGMVRQPLGEGSIERAAMPYTLWMAQRVLDVYRAMPPSDASRVAAWVDGLGGGAFLRLDIPRLRRVGLHAALAA